VLWSVNLTLRGILPEEGDTENLETGAVNTFETMTNPVFVNASLPFSLLAVNVTE
jgi:hypothetical protein